MRLGYTVVRAVKDVPKGDVIEADALSNVEVLKGKSYQVQLSIRNRCGKGLKLGSQQRSVGAKGLIRQELRRLQDG